MTGLIYNNTVFLVSVSHMNLFSSCFQTHTGGNIQLFSSSPDFSDKSEFSKLEFGCLLWIESCNGNSLEGESTEKEQGNKLICRKIGILGDKGMGLPHQSEGREWMELHFP